MAFIPSCVFIFCMELCGSIDALVMLEFSSDLSQTIQYFFIFFSVITFLFSFRLEPRILNKLFSSLYNLAKPQVQPFSIQVTSSNVLLSES